MFGIGLMVLFSAIFIVILLKLDRTRRCEISDYWENKEVIVNMKIKCTLNSEYNLYVKYHNML